MRREEEDGETERQARVSSSFLSATGIINAVVQMNREAYGDKQVGVPAS